MEPGAEPGQAPGHDWRDDFGEPDEHYGRQGHYAERVEWGYVDGQPLAMHPLQNLTGNEEDIGYYGIHVGGEEWLPILVEDYGRDPDTAQILKIDINGLLLIEDPNPASRTEVPDSMILVSKFRVLPPERIVKVRRLHGYSPSQSNRGIAILEHWEEQRSRLRYHLEMAHLYSLVGNMDEARNHWVQAKVILGQMTIMEQTGYWSKEPAFAKDRYDRLEKLMGE